jgi:nucleoside-diphosphate-sugar epimerase
MEQSRSTSGDVRVSEERLAGRKVLVVGGAGFLGRKLILRLGAEGARIHGISRRRQVEGEDVEWWVGSAAEIGWMRDVVSRVKPDVVYALTSASLGGQEAENVLPAFEDDLRAGVNTLLAAREAGCGRVILAQSMEEPEEGGCPPSPYAAAKAACAGYARMFQRLYGLPVVMLRPFMTFGPGQKEHKVIPYVILSMLRGRTPLLKSAGRRVDWVYVDDVVEGFVAAATSGRATGREMDLGTGNLVAIREVVEEIERLLPECPRAEFGGIADREGEAERVAKTALAWEVLGWKASTPLREGLAATVAWYRDVTG